MQAGGLKSKQEAHVTTKRDGRATCRMAREGEPRTSVEETFTPCARPLPDFTCQTLAPTSDFHISYNGIPSRYSHDKDQTQALQGDHLPAA